MTQSPRDVLLNATHSVFQVDVLAVYQYDISFYGTVCKYFKTNQFCVYQCIVTVPFYERVY